MWLGNMCVDPSTANMQHLKRSYPSAICLQSIAEYLIQIHTEPFDIAISFGVLHHLYEPQIGIHTCADKLNLGGIFLLHEPSDYWTGKMGSLNERGFARNDLIRLVESRFRILIFRTYHHPRLQRHAYSIASALRLWSLFFYGHTAWRLFFNFETLLSYVGIPGKDFLILVQHTS